MIGIGTAYMAGFTAKKIPTIGISASIGVGFILRATELGKVYGFTLPERDGIGRMKQFFHGFGRKTPKRLNGACFGISAQRCKDPSLTIIAVILLILTLNLAQALLH